MEKGKWAWQGSGSEEKNLPVQAKPAGSIGTKIVLALIGLLVLWLVFTNVAPVQNGGQDNRQAIEKATVSFKAISGEENVFEAMSMVAKGTNAFEAMQQVANVEFQDLGAMGAMVESINGVKPKQNEFWGLYINGEQSMVGISSITIEEDTAIEWKIENIESYAV